MEVGRASFSMLSFSSIRFLWPCSHFKEEMAYANKLHYLFCHKGWVRMLSFDHCPQACMETQTASAGNYCIRVHVGLVKQQTGVVVLSLVESSNKLVWSQGFGDGYSTGDDGCSEI